MRGEIAIGGVYIPSLLVVAVAAIILSFLIARLLTLVGAYRLFGHRPFVDLSIFVLVMGGLAFLFDRPAG